MSNNLFLDVFEAAMDRTFDERLDRDQRAKVAEAFILWLQNDAVKKSLPDLPERMKAFEKRIIKMTKNLQLVVEAGKLVVKVSGSDEDTWRRLRLGTEWFAGNDKAMHTLMAGIANESPVVKAHED